LDRGRRGRRPCRCGREHRQGAERLLGGDCLMTTTISVSGPGFIPYDVVVGRGVSAQIGARVAPLAQGRTVVVSDETVAALHGSAVLASLKAAGVEAQLLTVPPGEASKSWSQLEQVIDR